MIRSARPGSARSLCSTSKKGALPAHFGARLQGPDFDPVLLQTFCEIFGMAREGGKRSVVHRDYLLRTDQARSMCGRMRSHGVEIPDGKKGQLRLVQCAIRLMSGKDIGIAGVVSDRPSLRSAHSRPPLLRRGVVAIFDRALCRACVMESLTKPRSAVPPLFMPTVFFAPFFEPNRSDFENGHDLGLEFFR